MITNEIKEQFNEIFEEIVKNLDITESQYKIAVQTYQAVGKWLSDENSILSPYKPEILPQGSFLLGTMIKPVNDEDELDVDLVCRLEGKKQNWTQFDLKQIVGERLKENERYKSMMKEEEGRRCWTLNYADSSKYHMDILPSLVSEGHKELLERAFSSVNFKEFDKAAIRITDKQIANYKIDTNPALWPKSNPFGYATWFQQRSSIATRKSVFLSENVNPLPAQNVQKLPLQRVVQALKTHRDIMFEGDEDKPISIIITTLSAKAYNKETDIISALKEVINSMDKYIEVKFSAEHQTYIKWIANPVNEEENFADKWPDNKRKEENFYKWLKKLNADLNNFTEQRGIHNLQKVFSDSFGEDLIKESFSNLANKTYKQRKSGNLYMEKGSGILGIGNTSTNPNKVENHNFHGKTKK